MRRSSAILFSFFYLLTSFGIALNIHYCNGQIEFFEIVADMGNCCCGDEKDAVDCCNDETFFFQLDNEQQVCKNFRVAPEQSVPGVAETHVVLNRFINTSEAINFSYLDLPPPVKQPIWLLNCSLTFYG